MHNKYSNLSKEELLKLIEKQEAELKSKKYGLVWDSEREPEQVVLDCENNLPVLKRVKGKEIKTDDGEDNILIEGDNYHALTVLNYTHKEKIDVIYIDPPYNTGNKDFIYNDRFVDKEDGYRHSKWLNFMEKRLNIAKNLLKEAGVIFISIDDNEQSQLKMLCDKVFGEDNFIANLIWKKKQGGGNDSKNFVIEHEYILVYSKNISNVKINLDKNYELSDSLYPFNDEMGEYGLVTLDKTSIRFSQSLVFEIKDSDGNIYLPRKVGGKQSCWRWGRKKVENEYSNLVFKKGKVYTKYRRPEGVTSKSLLMDSRFGRTETGKELLKQIFNKEEFSYPKPMELIRHFLSITTNSESVVLDFMAGSGTTGHAVLGLNKEDGGNRKFILCTNNDLNGLKKELLEKGTSEKEMEKFGICQRVTFPRLEKVINGYKNPKGDKIEGLGGNLQYFKTSLIKKAKNRDQVVVDLTQKCTEMLCIRENIFNLDIEKEDYKIFSSNKRDKFLCVYYNFLDDSFADFLKEIGKLNGKKKIYIFSIDGKVDPSLFANVADFEIEEIPQKILDIYKQLVKMNIPVKVDMIFADFDKAKVKIFTEKEKDEGARILRIVLEKLMQRIAQDSGINILKNNSKEEKCAILNDKLKNENIFSKVDWQENKTYLVIGNHASHGEYGEYDLKNIENFYRHIQKLIDSFNI